MTWPDEITDLYDDLLTQLPLPVRESVRSAAEQRAEEAAEDAGGRLTTDIALRAFLEATPADLRARLQKTLSLHGLDPSDYDDAFAS
jgi:hypothetical protein